MPGPNVWSRRCPVNPTPHPRATLAATILGSSLAFIDGSVVNVALPAIAADLHASPSTIAWTINAYLLPLGALILLGGALGDHFGRRRSFLFGLLAFSIASTVCALAPTLGWLLAARGLQGVGAALLMPNSLAILGTAFEGEARGRAIGTWAAVGALAGVLGPIIGGLLVDGVGWRAIFLINLPVAAAAGYLAFRYVSERTEQRNPVPLDSAGAVLVTAALGLLTWSLTAASEKDASRYGLAAAALLGAALLAAFVWLERRRGERALMPLILLAAPTFMGLTLLTFFLYGSLGGLLVLLPYLLIRMAHWSAVAAGASLLPIPVIIGTCSRFMGRVASRHGGRLPLALGSTAVGLGLALYLRVDGHGIGYWRDIFPATLLVALGMGACVAPLTTSVMASVDSTHAGIASGFNSAVARIAGLIATALLGFVFVHQDSNQGFVAACHTAALLGAVSCLIAAASALLLIDRNPRIGQH